MGKPRNASNRDEGRRCLELRAFASVEAENRAEDERRARMSIEERLQEFAVIQARVFGASWTQSPMQKILFCEKSPWER